MNFYFKKAGVPCIPWTRSLLFPFWFPLLSGGYFGNTANRMKEMSGTRLGKKGHIWGKVQEQRSRCNSQPCRYFELVSLKWIEQLETSVDTTCWRNTQCCFGTEAWWGRRGDSSEIQGFRNPHTLKPRGLWVIWFSRISAVIRRKKCGDFEVSWLKKSVLNCKPTNEVNFTL